MGGLVDRSQAVGSSQDPVISQGVTSTDIESPKSAFNNNGIASDAFSVKRASIAASLLRLKSEPFLALTLTLGILATLFSILNNYYQHYYNDAAISELSVAIVLLCVATVSWLKFREYLLLKLDRIINPLSKAIPDHSWRKETLESTEQVVSSKEIKVGELIVVRAAEYIPVDGIIERGAAVMLECGATGRAVKRARSRQDLALAGSQVVSGEIVLRAASTVENSKFAWLVSRILKVEGYSTPNAGIYLGIIFCAACLVLGMHEFQIDWSRISNLTAVLLFTTIFLDLSIIYNLLPRFLAVKALSNGILFSNSENFNTLNECKNLVYNYHHRSHVFPPQIKDFIIFDERIDRVGLLSALLGIFSQAGDDLATAFESLLTYENANKLLPCEVSNFTEYPGLGFVARVSNAEFSVGSEDFILARGVKIQPSEITPSVVGARVFYIAIADDVIARFVFADSNLEHFSERLHLLGVRFRLWSQDITEKVDSFGKRVGLELANVVGGLTAKQFEDKLLEVRSTATLCLTAEVAEKTAIVQFKTIDEPGAFSDHKGVVTLLDNSTEALSASFKLAQRNHLLGKIIPLLGFIAVLGAFAIVATYNIPAALMFFEAIVVLALAVLLAS